MKYLMSFLKEEDGLAVTEYGLLLALVAVAVITVVKAFGTQLSAMFTNATTKLSAP
jgi:pilus assembly protein Flp/PilA